MPESIATYSNTVNLIHTKPTADLTGLACSLTVTDLVLNTSAAEVHGFPYDIMVAVPLPAVVLGNIPVISLHRVIKFILVKLLRIPIYQYFINYIFLWLGGDHEVVNRVANT